MNDHINLHDLDVYKVSIELSNLAWEIYNNLDWRNKKIIGDQFISSADSVGANIAEGCGRYHYLDKVKFYYNARGSLFEVEHWFYLLCKRKLIMNGIDLLLNLFKTIAIKLNRLINATKITKNKI